MPDSARLTIEPLTLPGTLPAPDPLPHPGSMTEAGFALAEDLPPDLIERSRQGWPRSMHPYLQQDRYGRVLSDLTLETVVLENEHLRARFVPALGGRLLSLVTLPDRRDLLYANPVLQPANLALRNAWFAGGVEWNIGTKGHTAHTMDPLHAARLRTAAGDPLLRMWELDRLRGTVFQVDAWLPAGARALHIYVRIQNPGPAPVPMYWWSNAAVPEADDVRVLAPATSAFSTATDGPVRHVRVPRRGDVDVSYPTRSVHAADYFFDIPTAARPWVAAVGADGHGLLQASTDRLRGRKMFCWGTAPGGAHWQDWLSPAGGRYLEIQAGLLPTQFEHTMVPARQAWDWLEVYGDAAFDPELAHGSDWSAAVESGTRAARQLLPDPDAALALARGRADEPPEEILAAGSPWGGLEAVLGGDRLISPGTPFPEPETTDLWSALAAAPNLAATLLREADPTAWPPSYAAGDRWRALLAAQEPGWARDYHLGVLAHADGRLDEAVRHYRGSLLHTESAWARRGLGQVAAEQGRCEDALAELTRALDTPGVAGTDAELSLTTEAMTVALRAGRAQEALAIVARAAPPVQRAGRVRLLHARAAWTTGTAGGAATARELLQQGIEVADLREGERELSDLWQAAFPGEPVPVRYDYRMR
ncbi:DUF5107 domain-containing protein [Ruania suaedae]|uniref:DUF5107 domain-containing protein n=1 Tax=Ruania suaedae TaxID=2897774 RepID=UPI001E352BA0|nr:DUF5107 domain-containing protein [Ruania suaedae]UFU04270.1 DUF5107 domain-containing protein [Ruania suaedae]